MPPIPLSIVAELAFVTVPQFKVAESPFLISVGLTVNDAIWGRGHAVAAIVVGASVAVAVGIGVSVGNPGVAVGTSVGKVGVELGSGVAAGDTEIEIPTGLLTAPFALTALTTSV